MIIHITNQVGPQINYKKKIIMKFSICFIYYSQCRLKNFNVTNQLTIYCQEINTVLGRVRVIK
jgi:hypothetical protein